MKNLDKIVVASLAGVLSVAGAFAQTSDIARDEIAPDSTASPVAFVYITNSLSASKNDVYAYTAASNGKLTLVSGAPFKDDIFTMGVNGKYLFGADPSGNIDSFLMESNGALKLASTTNPSSFNVGGCGDPGYFQIDHSGSYLYNSVVDQDCSGSHYQFFKIKSTGALSYVGQTDEQAQPLHDLLFLGNNDFAYNPICTQVDGEEVGFTAGFERHSNGELSDVSLGDLPPAAPQANNSYCPLSYATDPTKHVAALVEDEDGSNDPSGSPRIATYTADSNGMLTTQSTSQNMPTVTNSFKDQAGWLSMSVSGKLLAAGGSDGVEVFHFTGTSQATKFKTLLSGIPVSHVYWDNTGHMYVIGGTKNAGKLWVYNTSTTSITEATGSPYSIPNPYSIIVQDK